MLRNEVERMAKELGGSSKFLVAKESQKSCPAVTSLAEMETKYCII